MNDMNNKLKISCHHGDIDNPNQLFFTENLLENNNQIDICEIDFITFNKYIISTHDYDIKKIEKGSELHKWIDLVIIKFNKVLWIDIKENLDIQLNCAFDKFDTILFFKTLERLREIIIINKNIDILKKVWIGCQEKTVYNEIININNLFTTHKKWKIIYDIPSVKSYIWQIITKPFALDFIVNNCVYNEHIDMDLRTYKLISIDQSFFNSIDELVDFVNTINISKNTMIVLYNFNPNVPPIKVRPGIHIIMQYDL